MKKQEITAAVLSLFQIDREDPVRQETSPLAPPPKRTSLLTHQSVQPVAILSILLLKLLY
jgi:hypothetical protein